VATEHGRAEEQLAALSARYALPASASSNGEKPSTKVELIVILSTANARVGHARGGDRTAQATRRRLYALVCQQSDTAAADELAKMNPGRFQGPGKPRLRSKMSSSSQLRGRTSSNAASLRRADAGFVKQHAAVLARSMPKLAHSGAGRGDSLTKV
jgi:hypothetical protein